MTSLKRDALTERAVTVTFVVFQHVSHSVAQIETAPSQGQSQNSFLLIQPSLSLKQERPQKLSL